MELTASMADEQRVTRVIKGVTLKGTYSVQDGVVTVTTAIGSKTTQVGRAKPETLAYIMLRELFDNFHTDSPSVTADQPP